MKITSEIMAAEINQKLPSYYTTGAARITTIPGDDALWFMLWFTYPGIKGTKEKYCWLSVKEEMTSAEIDEWATAAVTQIKMSQQMVEWEEQAEQRRTNLDRA